jgi:hypothetical protein
MRLTRSPAPSDLRGGKTPATRWHLNLGWEDIVLALALAIIIISWLRGQYTPDQALAYLGFTTSGGIWGYMSGKESS